MAAMLIELLSDEGYAVDRARDGQNGLHLALSRVYDVIVLDRGLPVIDGVELLRRLRRRGLTTPVLMLTARGAVLDRVEGLDAGAEDYLVKPFETEELFARLRSLQRRHSRGNDLVPVASQWLDPATREIRDGHGRSVALSERECRLLQTLASRPREVFSRHELLGVVFDAAENPNVVDTYVHYLRRKLGPNIVRTVRGLGYQIGPE